MSLEVSFTAQLVWSNQETPSTTLVRGEMSMTAKTNTVSFCNQTGEIVEQRMAQHNWHYFQENGYS